MNLEERFSLLEKRMEIMNAKLESLGVDLSGLVLARGSSSVKDNRERQRKEICYRCKGKYPKKDMDYIWVEGSPCDATYDYVCHTCCKSE